ncbi:hypothetical protein NURINAE_01094 [Candidatus Nitrosacidococcus sp. I8]|nr:hypothetical protein NURINAE_01094 [Candidatus Nitrosacidococcus sp. I8]
METGTGKTYTYTKTIFELNKAYGIFKFIVVVPTLPIKAGTISFLKSESCRRHFHHQYQKTLELHSVESQNQKKRKKPSFPLAASHFVEAGNFDKNHIQVLVINSGMINSETMTRSFDKTLFDRYNTPMEALAATNAFMIIDEPHKFNQDKKTWENIQKIRPQFVLRYGATFKKHENLVYRLTAIESFNRGLVKGINGYIAEFDAGKNALVKLVSTDGREASFKLTEGKSHQSVKLTKWESLSRIHPAMTGLTIEGLNKTVVVLSNGLELERGNKINPYSYAQTVQEKMIQTAVHEHFQLEKQLLTREIRIKPLTLFFIDQIEEYRNEEGYLSKTLEQCVQSEVKTLLATEQDLRYREYLERTLEDLSQTHGGYFSKDNAEKDEDIAQEVNEILHDKQALLDLNNPRRFIFSKWTLREGWDNPNVFQICKLRSSGSEISKLQEVGRGLRLPVNEYGNRVKEEQFYLNYFVDFSESEFIDQLVNEINEQSGIENTPPEKLTNGMIKALLGGYSQFAHDENQLLKQLIEEDQIIEFNKTFKVDGFEKLKTLYPDIFQKLKEGVVKRSDKKANKITVRTERYHELKTLWEKLNEKVILEYQFKNEAEFKALLISFF